MKSNDLKVLILNDFASVGATMSKIIPNVDMCYFSKDKILTAGKNPIYFKSNDMLFQLDEFERIGNKYDIVICFGWTAATICYITNTDYIPYINDYLIDPEDRFGSERVSGIKKWFRNKLYNDVLINANAIVSGHRYYTNKLKKYRKDHIEEIFNPVDFDMFNMKPLSTTRSCIKKKRFTFLSPTRIEKWKGTDILWDAIEETKSDFDVLQVDWGYDEFYRNLMKRVPKKVKIIDKINHNELSDYYKSSDAVMGDIEKAYPPTIEKEAVACGVPVFHSDEMGYTDNDPFYQGPRDPKQIAKYIDRMVTDDKFRKDLQIKQYKWLHQIINYQKQLQQWNGVFETAKAKKRKKAKIIYRKVLEMTPLLAKIKVRKRGTES